MKKLHIYLLFIVFSSILFPSTIAASEKNTTAVVNKIDEVPDDVKIMINRLQVINKMDKSAMTRLEKKQLRKEIKEIKSNLENPQKNILASIGGMVIIILTMVLIL